MPRLAMLKLGGSLITDKDKPYSARRHVLSDIAQQIHSALEERAGEPGREPGLILGHGSGSFGHTAASEHGTFHGTAALPDTAEAREKFWAGFAEVRFRAAQLNALVMTELHRARVPSMAIPPSSAVVCRDRQIARWNLAAVRMALAVGLVPVVYGDVVFDEVLGGTILSTEDLFAHLARELHPERILLAGLEPGVWADFPTRKQLLTEVTPASFDEQETAIAGSTSIDVTGGMGAKVRQMLDLLRDQPTLAVQIFSGEEPGAVRRALEGAAVGTSLRAE